MPGKNGADVIALYKSLEVQSIKIPIIVISGYLSTEVYQDFKKYPEIYLLEKPVASETISELVKKLAEQSEHTEKAG
jgi:FixJ family two-component response regulator